MKKGPVHEVPAQCPSRFPPLGAMPLRREEWRGGGFDQKL